MVNFLKEENFDDVDVGDGSGAVGIYQPDLNDISFANGEYSGYTPSSTAWVPLGLSNAAPRSSPNHMSLTQVSGYWFSPSRFEDTETGNFYSYTVTDGSVVSVECYVRQSEAVDTIDTHIAIEFFDDQANSLQVTTTKAITDDGAYNAVQLQATAPTNSSFVFVFIFFESVTGGRNIYVDDVVFQVETEEQDEPDPALLSILRTGFRFPHPRWSRRSTATNLLFLERQLEQYMHSHEPVPEEDGGVAV